MYEPSGSDPDSSAWAPSVPIGERWPPNDLVAIGVLDADDRGNGLAYSLVDSEGHAHCGFSMLDEYLRYNGYGDTCGLQRWRDDGRPYLKPWLFRVPVDTTAECTELDAALVSYLRDKLRRLREAARKRHAERLEKRKANEAAQCHALDVFSCKVADSTAGGSRAALTGQAARAHRRADRLASLASAAAGVLPSWKLARGANTTVEVVDSFLEELLTGPSRFLATDSNIAFTLRTFRSSFRAPKLTRETVARVVRYMAADTLLANSVY